MKKTFLLTAIIVSILICSSQTFATGQLYSGVLGVKSNSKIAVNGTTLDLERTPVLINGRLVVPARTVFSKIGADVSWYVEENRLVITKDNDKITMYIGNSNCYVNGSKKAMEAPPILVDGTVMVPIRFVAETFNMSVGWDGVNSLAYIGSVPKVVASNESKASKVKGRVVVVDAGHGGNQSGAVYGGVKEKTLNLDIAKILNNKLKELGIVTYMTRSGDSSISLYSRSGLANSKKADLLISIHNNAGLKKYTGSMTLYYPSSSKTKGNLSSYQFASIVQKNMCETLGSKNMGIVPRSQLAVLRTSNMPAVIAEVGYMSNSSELAKLKTYAYKEKAAESLKKAVVESLEKMY
jgi:N-acetylmuramoyl-L-alanine amidase